MNSTKQPTVRAINAHTFAGTGYCYVSTATGRPLFRISRARTRKGVIEGRIVNGSDKVWEVIPADATIHLSW